MVVKRHISQIITPSSNRLNVVIIADKVPRRRKTLGTRSLFKIDKGITILEYQIRNIPQFKKYNYIDVYVVTGFQHDKIRYRFRGKTRAKLVYNPLFEETNTCYSVSLALENSYNGDLLIIDGNILYKKQAINDIVLQNTSKLVTYKIDYKDTDNVGVLSENNKIINMSYSLPNKWANIAFITNPSLVWFEKIIFNDKISKNWFLHEAIMHTITRNNCEYFVYPINYGIVNIEDTTHENFGTKITS